MCVCVCVCVCMCVCVCVCVCVCMCVSMSVCLGVYKREKEINNFEIAVIIFEAYKKCKSPIQINLQSAELLSNTPFFMHFRDRRKNGEENKDDIDGICARGTKHAFKKVAKAEANLN